MQKAETENPDKLKPYFSLFGFLLLSIFYLLAVYIFLMMTAIMQANILPEELLYINIMHRPVLIIPLKPVRLNMMLFYQLINLGPSLGPVLSAVMGRLTSKA